MTMRFCLRYSLCQFHKSHPRGCMAQPFLTYLGCGGTSARVRQRLVTFPLVAGYFFSCQNGNRLPETSGSLNWFPRVMCSHSRYSRLTCLSYLMSLHYHVCRRSTMHCGMRLIPTQKGGCWSYATCGSQLWVLFPLFSGSEEDRRYSTHHQPLKVSTHLCEWASSAWKLGSLSCGAFTRVGG